MSNPWFRLYAEFAHDPKVQMLSETDQRRLILVFCLRCNGDVTLQDEEVAFQLRISNESWATTKSLFVAKGFINEVNQVLNWDKRQFVSDSSTERVARHRKAKKLECNVTVTPPDTDTDTEKTEDIPPSLTVVPKKTASKGIRLPEDWKLPKAWGEWALGERPAWSSEDVRQCSLRFADFWHAKAGKDAVKLDWQATWRNWVRNDKAPAGASTGQGVAGRSLFAGAL